MPFVPAGSALPPPAPSGSAKQPTPSPNDQIGVGIIGCGRRNGQLMIGKGGQGAPPAHARIVAVADFNLKRAAGVGQELPHQEGVPGLPRAAGPERGGCRHLCHPGALALPALHPCQPGGQGHVRRTALEPYDPRGPHDGPGRSQVQSCVSDRRAAAVSPRDAEGRGTDSQRTDWQDPIGHRLQLSQRVRVRFSRAADSRVARLGPLVRAERSGALSHRSLSVACPL